MTMRSITAVGLIVAACSASTVVLAADKSLDIRSGSTVHYQHARHYRPYGGCPDGYSCYPLYGAYGPYGGRAYWAAYSTVLPEYYR
jgi:hypothetical protein